MTYQGLEKIMSIKKRGKSIVVVSHDMNTIQNHCDRAMFLNNGHIESIGEPKIVIDSYSKSFV